MTQPQLTVGLSGRFSVIYRPDTEEEGREIMRAVDVAPELLETLKTLVRRVERANAHTTLGCAVEPARAVIAKAETL